MQNERDKVATPLAAWPPLDARPRTWVEIDHVALRENIQTLRSAARGRALLAVMKADAYGHGALAVARTVREAGVPWIGVGDAAEALALRAAGDRGDILILGALVASEIPKVIAHRITPVVHSLGRLSEIAAEAERQRRVTSIHLKVDTGLSRLGMRPERLEPAVAAIRASSWLRLDGLMSHLAGGASDHRRNQAQCLRFARALARVRQSGGDPEWLHIRNSVGMADDALVVAEENLLRVGASIYGFAPARSPLRPDLRPVLSWRAQIAFLKDVPPGTRVGYDGQHTCTRRTRLAVLPVGYHDGVPRRLGEGGCVLVRGQRAGVLGRVSMDYATVDVTDIPGVTTQDVATLIGAEGSAVRRVEELAADVQAIPHEILCGIGARVLRHHR